ncbi:gliding motility-associated ABC transporter substrate-binding protein GldG [Flavobacteriales bacterium]|jgi:ABC-2 type transport system permease protein|nr:gliding motility-associated ABC transporter substrate-binding protein GldG [Flavobacteriales bacterium]MDB9931564.1 gliding motility-associated ABC transporter substrate-binding protein GldG [Flavobacteriales bacterium]|tara:strand:- start:159 stop:1883 length:1725 start_codon:yes stop_codon:yes gene_type:complete
MGQRTKFAIQIVAVAVVIILVNFIGSKKFLRMDLTEEKIHSLSEKTIEILQNDSLIKDELRFEVYLEGDLPPELRKLQLALKEKLSELKAYGGSNIYFEFIDPAKDETQKQKVYEQIFEFGLRPTKVSSLVGGSKTDQMVWGGIILRTVGNNNIPIQIMIPSNVDPKTQTAIPVFADRIPIEPIINDLEYLLLEGIYKAVNPNRKKIGFLQGHGELTEAQRFDVTDELKKFHAVDDVVVGGKLDALKGYDALIVAKPTKPISEKDKYLIDQFIMKGGKVAWLIDPVVVDTDSLQILDQTFGLERNLNLIDEQLFTYGVRLNKDLVIDINSAKIRLGSELYNWFYYPTIDSWRIKNPIVDNVNPIRLKYASTLDLLQNKEITKVPLLMTSEKSVTYKVPVRINYQMIGLKEEVVKYNAQPNQIVAVMLSGKFKSNFINRLTDNFVKNSPVKFIKESVENTMLVISDGDIINAPVDSFENSRGEMIIRPMRINLDRDDRAAFYGNKEFFVNAMEGLMGINDLIPLRSKTITLRPLNKTKVAKERKMWNAINVFIPMLIILVFGGIYTYLRRRKFSS